MRPLPFVNPYATTFWVVYGIYFFQETTVLGKRIPEPGEGWRQDRGSYSFFRWCWFCGVIAFVCAAKIHAAGFHGGQVMCFWAGVILIAAGTLLRGHCFKMLGEHFRPVVRVVPNQPVIERGAYKWIRHPSYLALISVMLGMSLALTNWISLVILGLAPLFVIAYRIRVEEQALVETLGQPYRDYMQRTKRLIPFLF